MKREKQEYFDTRQIVELTGISEFTLRGWEGRYGALQPARTDTGRRRYRLEDVSRIRALIDLTRRGRKISSIAALNLSQLTALLEQPEQIDLFENTCAEDPKEPQDPPQDPIVAKVISQLQNLDRDSIASTLRKYRTSSRDLDFIFKVSLPILKELGIQVDQGHMSVVQEHILSVLIKENLYAIRASLRPAKTGELFIVATPEGDFHEMGALIADTLLGLNGIKTFYLGPHVPKADLCETAVRCKASHLLVACTSSTARGAKDSPLSMINFLDRHLPKGVSVWLGGKGVGSLKLDLQRDFKIFQRMDQLVSAVKELTIKK